MGIRVILDIDPKGIDAAAWEECFEETLRLLRSHPARLMGYDVSEVFGTELPVYTRDIERGRGTSRWRWSVVGDRESLLRAECQELLRDLAAYRRRRSGPACEDIVWWAAGDEDGGGPVRVFGDKTQGLPYHLPVLGAAMAVESRFPRQAMVSGDIDREQALRAQRWVQDALGRPVALPVRVDAPELARRLEPRFSGKKLIKAFARLYIGESPVDELEAVLRAFPREVSEPWFASQLRQSPADSVRAGWQLTAWLNATGDLRRLCELACVDARGPRFEPRQLVQALADAWLAVPPEATAFLDAFKRSEGEPPTIASALATSLLGQGALGRNLETRWKPEVVDERLREAFGDRAQELAALFRARTKSIEDELAQARAAFPAFAARAREGAVQTAEELAVLGSAEQLTDHWRRQLHVLAHIARRARGELLRSDGLGAGTLIEDPDGCRKLLARLHARGPVLTESAWERIGAENDPYVLQLLLGLASIDSFEEVFCQLRRAVFENEALCRFMVEASREVRLMEQIASQPGGRDGEGAE